MVNKQSGLSPDTAEISEELDPEVQTQIDLTKRALENNMVPVRKKILALFAEGLPVPRQAILDLIKANSKSKRTIPQNTIGSIRTSLRKQGIALTKTLGEDNKNDNASYGLKALPTQEESYANLIQEIEKALTLIETCEIAETQKVLAKMAIESTEFPLSISIFYLFLAGEPVTRKEILELIRTNSRSLNLNVERNFNATRTNLKEQGIAITEIPGPKTRAQCKIDTSYRLAPLPPQDDTDDQPSVDPSYNSNPYAPLKRGVRELKTYNKNPLQNDLAEAALKAIKNPLLRSVLELFLTGEPVPQESILKLIEEDHSMRQSEPIYTFNAMRSILKESGIELKDNGTGYVLGLVQKKV